MAWGTTRPDVTCDTPSQCPITGISDIRLPGPLLIRILLWLLIFAAFPLSVTAARLSFKVEVLRRSIPSIALPPGSHATLSVEGVLRHLESAEEKEADPWLQDDIRIAWITVLEASRGNHQPHIDATYRVLGLHPDKVWPAICARRAALLGPESERLCVTPVDSSAAPMTASRDAAVTGAPIRLAGMKTSTKKNSQKTSTTTITPPKKPCAGVRRKKVA